MAKLTGPLLSLGASGKIADSLVYGTWKGINVVRQKVNPSNPQTAAQVAQRALMEAVVNFWHGANFTAAAKTGWNVAASLLSSPMSGFNAYTSQAVKLAAVDPDASMCVGVSGTPSAISVVFVFENLDDNGTGDESGLFTIRVGTTKSSLPYTFSQAISGGSIDLDISSQLAAGEYYFLIEKSSGGEVYQRSGLMLINAA